jgi:hypothetical protein
MGPALIASVVLASPVQPDPIRLANGLKADDILRYEVKVKVEDTIHVVEYTSDLVYRVMEVKANGDIAMLSEQTGIKMRHFENVITTGDPPATFVTFDAAGYITTISGQDINDEDYRFQSLNLLIWPKSEITVGSKWSAVLPGDETIGSRAGMANYEVVARETLLGRDTVKLRYTIEETEGDKPAKAEGSMWVDMRQGSKVKVISTMVNAPLAGRPVRAEYELTMKL